MIRPTLALTLAILICFPAVIAGRASELVPNILAVPTLAAPAPTVPPALPPCAYADVATPLAGYDDWRLTMLDTRLTLSSSYDPPDLVSTAAAGLGGGFYVRDVVIADLQIMARDAAQAGAPLAVMSAYRTYREQSIAFSRWVQILGPKQAPLGSARPGHSEHQLGTAVDFKSKGGPLPWTYYSWARDTAAGRWMASHAWQYGFVMSYPAGKTKKTCYGYEPWHYRYVGRETAAQIHASRLTLREWLWRHQPGN